MIRKSALLISLVTIVYLLCRVDAGASYEPSSDQVLIFLDTSGGVRAPVYDLARVPVFCLYKNGDCLYSYYDEREGLTKVMRVHLEEKDVTSLIAFVKERDFNEWNDYYECPLNDAPITKIYIDCGGEGRIITIWGIDYAMKSSTIPPGLSQVYRKFSLYSSADAAEYEPGKIILFVRQIPEEPKGPGVTVHKWREKIDLAPLAEEAGLSGYGSILLEDKNAKSVYKALKDKVPFSRQALSVYFRQGKKIYSLAYRPLLLHEIGKEETKEKK